MSCHIMHDLMNILYLSRDYYIHLLNLPRGHLLIRDELDLNLMQVIPSRNHDEELNPILEQSIVGGCKTFLEFSASFF